MILGIITAIFFLAECMLFLWNRFRKSPSKRIMKIHCIGGFVTLTLAAVHFISVLQLWWQRPLLMNISGCVMLVCIATICILFIIKKNKAAVHRILACIVIAMLGMHIYSGISSFSNYKVQVKQIDIENINISTIPNGIYEGECNVGYIYAHVSVTVLDGEITDIEILEHRNEREVVAENIVSSIISQQKIDVDAVTSATNSSKVIQKAIETALKSA